jgi:hypothetical protein
MPAWLIPLLAQAAGTGLGYLQRGPSYPRVDISPSIKAARMAGQIPSGSTIMGRGRQRLGEQIGAMRSQISRLGQDANIRPEAIRTISEAAYPRLFSTYIQGLGKIYGQAIRADVARAEAAGRAAQLQQQGQVYNAQIAEAEEAARPNPLEWGAMAGSLLSNIMNIEGIEDYINALMSIFSSYKKPPEKVVEEPA